VVLRNYEGLLVRYQAQDKPVTAQPTTTRGVSGLLQGDKTVLIPEGNERMRRRSLRMVSDRPEPEHHGCGCGESEDMEQTEPVFPMAE
jgi:lysine 2,3-aminomutase